MLIGYESRLCRLQVGATLNNNSALDVNKAYVLGQHIDVDDSFGG